MTDSPKHSIRIAALAWPILIGQLAVIANGVIDTAMTSRFSATDLAALAIGASIYISVFVGLNGVLAAISPVIGQLYGAGRFEAIGIEVKQGAWLALFLTIGGCLLLLFPQPLLSLAQASPELNHKAVLYLRILALALPATMGFRLYASLNTAIGRPKMVMALQVAALALKIPVNGLFIFGGFGMPAMGGRGVQPQQRRLPGSPLLQAASFFARAPRIVPSACSARGSSSQTGKRSANCSSSASRWG